MFSARCDGVPFFCNAQCTIHNAQLRLKNCGFLWLGVDKGVYGCYYGYIITLTKGKNMKELMKQISIPEEAMEGTLKIYGKITSDKSLWEYFDGKIIEFLKIG